ncbi:MAG: hypothetical protein H6563_11710 [Lewinellaceae bacterium]|nr:hypothetical protein [Lewinellaceae bacterium]
MKKSLFFLIISLTSCCLLSQSAFDKALEAISSDLATKLDQKDKKKVVVLYVTDLNKTHTVAGKYLGDMVSSNIVNNPGNFMVFDRENLSGIAEANKLIADGFIDVDQAKELGKLLAVDAIITGNYTVLSNTIKLHLKALDASNGFVIASSIKDLPIDGDAGALLGINIPTSGGGVKAGNLGFNRPLNSNEQYNNPETVDKECETKNIGDFCFTNNTSFDINVEISRGSTGRDYFMTLSPGQTQCIYNLAARAYYYHVAKKLPNGGTQYSFRTGQILVEKCKSKTFAIK